ncbi:MAG TPA: redoxin domain-containing protein [Chloroflexota bacterium]
MDNHLNPLPPGTIAPDFTLHETPWRTLSLHRLAGQLTVLTFFPTAFEPVSREQLPLYQDFLPKFEEFSAQLVGISADHAWCHAAFAEDAGIRFPLLSDMPPQGTVSRLYGVYREQEERTGRALFVIDRGGIIRFSRSYPDLLNPGVDDPLTVLEGMSAEEVKENHHK